MTHDSDGLSNRLISARAADLCALNQAESLPGQTETDLPLRPSHSRWLNKGSKVLVFSEHGMRSAVGIVRRPERFLLCKAVLSKTIHSFRVSCLEQSLRRSPASLIERQETDLPFLTISS